jgi:hypothetical protein
VKAVVQVVRFNLLVNGLLSSGSLLVSLAVRHLHIINNTYTNKVNIRCLRSCTAYFRPWG